MADEKKTCDIDTLRALLHDCCGSMVGIDAAYLATPAGQAWLRERGDACDRARAALEGESDLSLSKLIADHDKLLQCLSATVMALGGGVKLHAMQLNLAQTLKLSFKVEQPFIEIFARPRDDSQTPEERRIMLADSLTGLPKPPGKPS